MADAGAQELKNGSWDHMQSEDDVKSASFPTGSTTAPMPLAEKDEPAPFPGRNSSPAQLASDVLPVEHTSSPSPSKHDTAASEERSSTSMRIYREAEKEVDDKLLALDQALESDLTREQSASGELMGKYEKSKGV